MELSIKRAGSTKNGTPPKTITIKCKTCIKIFWILLAIFLFLFCNFMVGKLIAIFTGGLIALFVVFAGYYYLIRRVIIWIVFPGSFCFFKRSIEFSFMKSFAYSTVEYILDFKNCIEIFTVA